MLDISVERYVSIRFFLPWFIMLRRKVCDRWGRLKIMNAWIPSVKTLHNHIGGRVTNVINEFIHWILIYKKRHSDRTKNLCRPSYAWRHGGIGGIRLDIPNRGHGILDKQKTFIQWLANHVLAVSLSVGMTHGSSGEISGTDEISGSS